jgi:hypothetical protein
MNKKDSQKNLNKNRGFLPKIKKEVISAINTTNVNIQENSTPLKQNLSKNSGGSNMRQP